MNYLPSIAATSLTMGTAHSKCVAYEDFRALLDDIRSKYTHLNPEDGELFEYVRRSEDETDKELDDTGMEFVRGGIVAIMSAWESYVHDLFEEAFEVVIKVCSTYGRETGLRHLYKQWPPSRTIIQTEVERQAAQKHGSRVEVLAFDLLLEADQESEGEKKTWEKLLNAHCDRVLHGKTLLPIFDSRGIGRDNVMTIDELFRQLFQIKKKGKSLSDILIEVGGFKYVIRIPENTEVTLEPAEASDRSAVDALCNISRLYYGLRCALVHGKHRKTLEGALKGFPDNSDNFPMPAQNDEVLKKYYVDLYERIKKYGRNADVSYLTFLNLTRFYSSAAYFLMLAIAKWFYDLQPDDGHQVRIWGYHS